MNNARISKKAPHNDNRITLTALHEKKMKEFEEYYATLPEKQKLLEYLQKKYKSLRTSVGETPYLLKKEINELEDEIENMINKTQETEYFMKASQYLQDYKKCSNNSNNESQNKLENSNEEIQIENNDLDTSMDALIDDDDDEYGPSSEGISNSLVVKLNNKFNKGKISKEYLQECLSDGFSLGTEKTNKNDLYCYDCKIYKIINFKESMATCPNCNITSTFQDNDICAEFSEEIEVLSQFSYKRINHFKEWLSTIMARESSGPKDEVIDILYKELKINRITNKDAITPKLIRSLLRKNGLNKQYEHIQAIICKLTGKPPPRISKELENKLISMFDEMTLPFLKHKPPGRKNFLSYSYTLHKFCQILGEDELLKSFPLLKSREKLYAQDQIFERIAGSLAWPFYPSI
jgi:hypothetical protein